MMTGSAISRRNDTHTHTHTVGSPVPFGIFNRIVVRSFPFWAFLLSRKNVIASGQSSITGAGADSQSTY